MSKIAISEGKTWNRSPYSTPKKLMMKSHEGKNVPFSILDLGGRGGLSVPFKMSKIVACDQALFSSFGSLTILVVYPSSLETQGQVFRVGEGDQNGPNRCELKSRSAASESLQGGRKSPWEHTFNGLFQEATFVLASD